jgi:hypothetical protein
VRQWNPSVHAENVFGMVGPVDYMVVLEGRKGADDVVQGHLSPASAPQMKLPIRMVFIEKLPG